MYRFLIRPLLYLLDPERAHHLAFGALRLFASLPFGRSILRLAFGVDDPILRTTVLGLDLAHPVGLAAGFDKDAIGFEALAASGFAFVEIGTLTGEAQTGNPKPRLFRLPLDEALVNRMGFNNRGSSDAASRLAGPRDAIVGVNIGKTKVVEEENAISDYVASTERLAALADYFVVNVSSPNTPGLRNLQAVDKLRPLLASVRSALDASVSGRRVPLLVKIAPDLADEDVDGVADLALELGLDGIIATNTTIGRAGLRTEASVVAAIGAGGLSGPILASRSREVLARLRARVGARLVLISVGGIDSAEEAYARIRAGASLVQIYTGYIYGGPSLPKSIARGIAALLRRDGFASLADAVGADAPRIAPNAPTETVAP